MSMFSKAHLDIGNSTDSRQHTEANSDISSSPQLLLPLFSNVYEALHPCPTLMHAHHHFPHT